MNSEQVTVVRRRKVLDASDPPRVAQLDGILKHAVKSIENRDLNKRGPAAPERIDAVFLVNLHGFFIGALFARVVKLVLLVSFLDLFDDGRDLLHSLRGLDAAQFQREHGQV